MERVGILVHPTRPVHAGVEALERWTEKHGLELVQIPAGEQPQVAPPGTVSACDVVAALGGDGTVLKALHAAAGTMTPVLGVAFGSLGALTTVPTTGLVPRWTALNAFLCTPLAMHGGSAPPLVIPFGRQLTLELHPGHPGFDIEVDGFEVESAERHFVVKNERSYATPADVDHPGRGLSGLRDRGLISDSPRVLPGRNQR
jgi:NAD kinase